MKGFGGFTFRLLIQIHFSFKRPKVMKVPKACSLLLIQRELESHFIIKPRACFQLFRAEGLPKEKQRLSSKNRNRSTVMHTNRIPEEEQAPEGLHLTLFLLLINNPGLTLVFTEMQILIYNSERKGRREYRLEMEDKCLNILALTSWALI